MTHLEIRNIGPITKVELTLNKVNVFIGPQSSGKSTIAKIISFCFWIEKNVCLFRNTFEIEQNFRKLLEDYHGLHGYIRQDSSFTYKSDYLKIILAENNRMSGFLKLEEEKIETYTYKRPKITYIPAERNLVATISTWDSLRSLSGNLKDFAADWGSARELFKKEIPLNINFLNPTNSCNTTYYYNKEEDADYIAVSNGHKETALRMRVVSSGMQSSTPLYLLHKVHSQYRQQFENSSSVKDIRTLDTIYNRFHYSTIRSSAKAASEVKSDVFEYKGKYCVVGPGRKEQIIKILNNYTETQFLQSIIEEPELNLFPQTQQLLTYELIADTIRYDNQLTITTHSPYILFALNNCIMGGLVGNNIPVEERDNYPSYHSWIDPTKVSVYEIHDGNIKCIQDKDGILEDNYLNQAYK